jgi:lipid-A-disaccharide synthase-like uncharacterized protein
MLQYVFNLIGYAGTALIAGGFLLAMLGHADRRPRLFLWINLVGGVALCLPAYVSGTLAAHALNGFWILVAGSSLLALRLRRDQVIPGGLFKVYVVTAGGALLASWALESSASMAGLLAIAGVMCFMVGYLALATRHQDARAFRTYLVTSVAGNVLYIPILVEHANYPILLLQVCCLLIAVSRLLRDRFWPPVPGYLKAMPAD